MALAESKQTLNLTVMVKITLKGTGQIFKRLKFVCQAKYFTGWPRRKILLVKHGLLASSEEIFLLIQNIVQQFKISRNRQCGKTFKHFLKGFSNV